MWASCKKYSGPQLWIQLCRQRDICFPSNLCTFTKLQLSAALLKYLPCCLQAIKYNLSFVGFQLVNLEIHIYIHIYIKEHLFFYTQAGCSLLQTAQWAWRTPAAVTLRWQQTHCCRLPALGSPRAMTQPCPQRTLLQTGCGTASGPGCSFSPRSTGMWLGGPPGCSTASDTGDNPQGSPVASSPAMKTNGI